MAVWLHDIVVLIGLAFEFAGAMFLAARAFEDWAFFARVRWRRYSQAVPIALMPLLVFSLATWWWPLIDLLVVVKWAFGLVTISACWPLIAQVALSGCDRGEDGRLRHASRADRERVNHYGLWCLVIGFALQALASMMAVG